MPLFFIHTYFGVKEFVDAPKKECRMKYNGEVIYIIVATFAISMCVTFTLMLVFIILPTWWRKYQHRRRTSNITQRLGALNGLDEGLVDDNVVNGFD